MPSSMPNLSNGPNCSPRWSVESLITINRTRSNSNENIQSETARPAPLLWAVGGIPQGRITIEQVVDKLGLVGKFGMTRTGNSLQGDCPAGHDSTNHKCFSVDLRITCIMLQLWRIGDMIRSSSWPRDQISRPLNWLIDTLAPDLRTQLELNQEGLTASKRNSIVALRCIDLYSNMVANSSLRR